MVTRWTQQYVDRLISPDNKRLFVTHADLSGGMNTRQHGKVILENQAELLSNVDLSVPGKRVSRSGSVLGADDVSNNPVLALFSAGTELVMVEGVNVRLWPGYGNWGSPIYTSISGTDIGITFGKESGLSPDDIVIVQDGVNNAQRSDMAGNIQDLGDTNTSPPKSTVGCWFSNRFWFLLNDLLYFSDAYDEDYSGAFDRTTNVYRVSVGAERALVPTRDMGIVCFGKTSVWSLVPSVVPAATDQPQPLILDKGAVSKKAVVPLGDDIFFFSQDGLRALKRTVQDKLQTGESKPISFVLKKEFEDINWTRITETSMVAFDNKLLISVPTGATDFTVWCYYPSMNSFSIIEGWNPSCWAVYNVAGEDLLYYGSNLDGEMYRAFYGYTDEGTTTSDGTAITYTEIGRKEDFEQPFVYKNGGEIEVRVEASGDYSVDVYASFDDGAFNYLGAVNASGNLITFPTTFPVSFSDESVTSGKFHLDPYGRWRHIQVKLEYDTSAADDDITILEHSIFTYAEEYQGED